ncbi:hypothetical protein Tfer_0035 [Thermincola ferriacetica]|uniref:Lipoprotein n=2 Tax=Thermincola ferriacetica TaxID=281456 RepID=A0A0L6W689_9FIRM|nr:hypothetical protein Tfer_0035 [Thermincola ferriacetica]
MFTMRRVLLIIVLLCMAFISLGCYNNKKPSPDVQKNKQEQEQLDNGVINEAKNYEFQKKEDDSQVEAELKK